MTTLAQARKALNEAQSLNTAEAWQAAALAFAAASEVRTRKAADPLDAKHTDRKPIMHAIRCTLSNGYSLRVTIGQWKGESERDCLRRMARFTTDCYRADNLCVRPVSVYADNTSDYIEARPWQDGARLLHCPHDVVDCRIVKNGRDGIDLEETPMMEAAE